MPCDTIQTNSVNLGNLGDKTLLVQALEAIGQRNARVVGDRVEFGDSRNGGTIFGTGVMDTRGTATNLTANEIKRAYSGEAVKLAAQKFGWNIKTTSATTFQAVRRF